MQREALFGMSGTADVSRHRPSPWLRPRRIIGVLVVIVLIVGMALDTAVVPLGSTGAANKFSPAEYGKQKFPDIQQIVQSRAVEASKLAKALAADKSAAVDQYA